MLDKHLCAEFVYHCLLNTSKTVTLPEKLQVFVSQCLRASISRHQHPAFHWVGLRIEIQLLGTLYWVETSVTKTRGWLYCESRLLDSQALRK